MRLSLRRRFLKGRTFFFAKNQFISACNNPVSGYFSVNFSPQQSWVLLCQLFHYGVCVRLKVLLSTSLHLIALHASWHGFKDLDAHLSNACSPMVRLDFHKYRSHTTIWQFWSHLFRLVVVFNKHLWAAWFSYSPSVGSFWFWSPCGSLWGAHTHTRRQADTHMCVLVNNHSCFVDMLIFQCGSYSWLCFAVYWVNIYSLFHPIIIYNLFINASINNNNNINSNDQQQQYWFSVCRIYIFSVWVVNIIIKYSVIINPVQQYRNSKACLKMFD